MKLGTLILSGLLLGCALPALAQTQSPPPANRTSNESLDFGNGSTFFGDYMQGEGARMYGQSHLVDAVGRARIDTAIASRQMYELDQERLTRLRGEQAGKKQTELERRLYAELLRYRDRPSTADIQSGQALNYLLQRVPSAMSARHLKSISLGAPCDPTQIRLGTKCGLTRQIWETVIRPGESRVNWPKCVAYPEFRELAGEINGQLAAALDQLARDGKAETQLGRSLLSNARQYRERVKEFYADSDSPEWRAAQAFFLDLYKVVNGLQTGEASLALDGTLSPAAESYEELLLHVRRHQLVFAAAPGEALSQYQRLHQLLAETHRAEITIADSRK